MPSRPSTPVEISRRQALGLGAATVAATVLTTPSRARASDAGAAVAAPLQSTAGALRPTIRPRRDWAGDDLGVKGEILAEDDVRFLLVHHTASTNEYGPDEVADQIRDFYTYHTGPDKGWPDVAYNFFVDRYGGIWEGRQGSIDGPVRGDATGGSQGFALLCSLIGDFRTEPATPEQQDSLAQLLAWLGETYAVDTSVGATTSFVSRGSNKWPAGTDVTTTTIAGHRDMSQTTCPGDAVYALLAAELPTQVTELRTAAPDDAEPENTTSTTASADPDDTEPGLPATSPGSTADTSVTQSSASGSSTSGRATASSEVASAPPTGTEDSGRPWPLAAAAAVAAAAAAAGIGAVARFARSGR